MRDKYSVRKSNNGYDEYAVLENDKVLWHTDKATARRDAREFTKSAGLRPFFWWCRRCGSPNYQTVDDALNALSEASKAVKS